MNLKKDQLQKALRTSNRNKIHLILQDLKRENVLPGDKHLWLCQALKRIKKEETINEAINIISKTTENALTYAEHLIDNPNTTKEQIIKLLLNSVNNGFWPSNFVKVANNFTDLSSLFNQLLQKYLETTKIPSKPAVCSVNRFLVNALNYVSKEQLILSALQHNTTAPVLQSIAKNSYITSNIVNKVVEILNNQQKSMHVSSIFASFMSNPATPKEFLLEWFKNPPFESSWNFNIYNLITGNPSITLDLVEIPPETSELKTFLLDKTKANEILKNPSTSSNIIEVIFKKYKNNTTSDGTTIIKQIVGHPNTPKDILKELLNVKDSTTRQNRIFYLSKKFKVIIT